MLVRGLLGLLRLAPRRSPFGRRWTSASTATGPHSLRCCGGPTSCSRGSRARALDQLGIWPADVGADRPGLTWVSITGYGRSGPWADGVAFGGQAAVAGGLVALDDHEAPLFCADALADPLAGLAAAVARTASLAVGGGRLVEVPLQAVANHPDAGPPVADHVVGRLPV